MADNVAVTAGSGTSMAADEVTDATLGTVKVPFAKIMTGALDGTNKLIVDSHGSAQITQVDSSGNATAANANGQATAANSQPVVQPSDRQNSVSFAVDMSTSTGGYSNASVLYADTQQLDAFFNKTDGAGVINSVTVIDVDAQGAPFTILFHKTSTTAGTEGSAPNINDANTKAAVLGTVAVSPGDYVAFSGTKIASIKNIGLPVKAVSGTDDLYVSILGGATSATFASGTIPLIIGALLD